MTEDFRLAQQRILVDQLTAALEEGGRQLIREHAKYDQLGIMLEKGRLNKIDKQLKEAVRKLRRLEKINEGPKAA